MRHGRGAGKGRDSRRSRTLEKRTPRPRALILCEGEKTEPNYFRALLAELGLTNVVLVEGAGGDPLHLVRDAKARTEYEAVWCVFDRDSFPADRFDNAVRMCDGKRLRAIWSNEAFELWYVLHFQYLDSGAPGAGGTARAYYQSRLESVLGSYAKNDPAMWGKLRDRLPDAHRNAERLWRTHGPELPPHAWLPATRVGALIAALNAYKEFESTPS